MWEEREGEGDKLHKNCVSERERERESETEREKRMSWHRIFAYEPERPARRLSSLQSDDDDVT